MITIFNTGEFDYSDSGIDKPVKYTVDNLIDIASRTSEIDITKEHSRDIVGVMSNFVVKDGMLQAEEPKNLELKGMGFSPVFEFDLVDMGSYYEPRNIQMTEIGYTKKPRTKIVYNSITVSNGENMEDKQLRDALDNNKKLSEEIGVLKSQIKQLKQSNQKKEKEISEIKENYSDVDKKLGEYDSLKEIETSYNKLISSRRDDLIHQICGSDSNKAEKFKNYSIEQLETTLELVQTQKGGKGVTPQNHKVDDGNDPSSNEGEEDVYTDEMFEADFEASGL